MTLKEFTRRFLFHVTLAATVWLIVALAVERIVPGFVAPFVNLPFVGLIIGCAMAIQMGMVGSSSRSGRVAGAVALLCISSVSGLFVWSRVNEYGSGGILLVISAGVLAGLTIFALTVESR